jgi:hypothetical protein
LRHDSIGRATKLDLDSNKVVPGPQNPDTAAPTLSDEGSNAFLLSPNHGGEAIIYRPGGT